MIYLDEFTERLASLCLGGSHGLPRRVRDRHIVLASATLWMEEGTTYSEPEVNTGLSVWLREACPALDLDVTTLRRELVDHLYLDRDDSGRNYSAGSGPVEPKFADEIARVDPAEIVAEERARRAVRRAAHSSESGHPTQGG